MSGTGRLLYAAGLATITTIAVVHAQFGGANANWPTVGADAQRTSWMRNETKLSASTMGRSTFQLLWKAKLENAPSQLTALTQPLLWGRRTPTCYGLWSVVEALESYGTQAREDQPVKAIRLVLASLLAVLAALNDKDENVRKQAVIALGRIKDPEAVDALLEKLQDKDWFIRLTAAAALETIGDERGREAIKPLLQDPDLVVKMRVERILASWKKRTPSPSNWTGARWCWRTASGSATTT